MSQRRLLSPIKIFTFEILDDLKLVAYKKMKQSWLKPICTRLLNYVFKPAIEESEDVELFNDIFNMYKKLDKYFIKMKTVELVNEGEKLGSPKLPRLGDIKKAMDLVNNVL